MIHKLGPLAAWACRPASAWLVCLAVGGCSSTLEPSSGDVEQDLRHRDPRLRVLAARAVVVEEREELIPLMIENLADGDTGVRFWTAIALRKLTGQSFGFKAHAPLGERRRAIERWKNWAATGAGEEQITGPSRGRAPSGTGAATAVEAATAQR